MSRQAKWQAAVEGAATAGYRHFDCASVYGNEPQIGYAFQQVWRSSIQREQVWITSKLWNDKHGENDVIPSCKRSLADLRLDYLDLYLVHWPFPNFHPPGCDVTSRSKDAKPYIHANFMKTWRKMEELVDLGPGAAHRHLEYDRSPSSSCFFATRASSPR